MNRAPETPLILWICAAVCAHFLFAEGGTEVATIHDGRSFMYRLAAQTRGKVQAAEQVVEVLTTDEGQPKEAEPPEAPKPQEEAKKEDPPKPPDPAKPKEEPKKPEPPKPDVKVVVKPDDPLKKLDEVPLKPDKRIAVRQHVKPNQADNPNAKFAGDEANHVEEESVATQTSHDQDDPNPTPGMSKSAGPRDRTGDSERTKIAESEEHKGDKEHAPGEKGSVTEVQKEAKLIEKPQGPVPVQQPPQPATVTPRAGGDGRTASQVTPKDPPPQLSPGTPPTQTPEVATAPNGGWFNPVRPGARQGPADPVPGTSNQKQPVVQNSPPNTRWLGLGGKPGPGQVNLNLNQTGVVAVVGVQQLKKEREADGERRLSQHRGPWKPSGLDRIKSQIENYVASVKHGNTTALNTAAVPFAKYLHHIHNRVHPIFADEFLGSLEGLPDTHAMNQPGLKTILEVVVDSEQGKIVKMGVTRTSGVTAFDIAALDAMDRAGPFGKPPSAIKSPDGNVYLHWEFHRKPEIACMTGNAHPYMLAAPPAGGTTPSGPTLPGPRVPLDPREKGAPPPPAREGAIPPVDPKKRAG